ncbi:hypothetical protein M3Y97_00641600 [Aphelenchoides bicaudatus]|nr:hypothetical protein M3Y97_00641600 [Aphelenchoides bicaudatus]
MAGMCGVGLSEYFNDYKSQAFFISIMIFFVGCVGASILTAFFYRYALLSGQVYLIHKPLMIFAIGLFHLILGFPAAVFNFYGITKGYASKLEIESTYYAVIYQALSEKSCVFFSGNITPEFSPINASIQISTVVLAVIIGAAFLFKIIHYFYKFKGLMSKNVFLSHKNLIISLIVQSSTPMLCIVTPFLIVPIIFNFYPLNGGHYLENGQQLDLTLGTPMQSFHALLSPLFNDILVVDSECGKTLKGCPRYCKDELFVEYYCHPLCKQITIQSIGTYCSSFKASSLQESANYSRKDSVTSKQLNKEPWRHELSNSRSMFGIYVQDFLQFEKVGSVEKSGWLRIGNTSFVSGLLLDNRIFVSTNAIVGMAPGHNTFFYRLYKDGIIAKPVISIAGTSRANQIMMAGSGERVSCTDWRYFQIVNDTNGWVIEVDEVTVMGHVVSGKTRLSFDISRGFTYMPQKDIDILVKEGKYWPESDTEYLSHCNANNITMEFKITGHKTPLSLKHADFAVSEPNASDDSFCTVYIGKYPLRRSDKDIQYSFGHHLMSQRCQSYDFEKRQVGLGRWTGPFESG